MAHTKGGVGKTTIATNLAVELNCPILDLDFQGSSIRFAQLRDQELPPLITFRNEGAISGDALKYLEKAKNSKTTHIVIDSGGMDNNIIREGLIYADIIITPVSVSQVEFFGLEDFDHLLNDKAKKAYVILNNVNLQAKNNIAASKEFIKNNFNFNLLTSMLGTRVAYREAYMEGKSVKELDPSSKAATEINTLINELKSIVNL